MPFDFFRPIVTQDQSQNLLTVKYKPKRLDQIAGHSEVISTFKNYVATNNLPNLIITGPSGVGKRTTIECLTRELLGEYYNSDVLILDGSIDRGKSIVTENQASKKKQTHRSENNIINFLKKRTDLPDTKIKIIVIYDFDHMTTEAQMALRRIIENKSSIARFIFVTNDHNDIIEAIQSRTVIIKFNHLENEIIREVLVEIIEKENKKINDELLDLILLASYGDLKQALIYLQVVLRSPNSDIEEFYQIFNLPYLTEIVKLVKYCFTQKQNKPNPAYKIIEDLLQQGYHAIDLLDIFFKVLVVNNTGLNREQQSRALETLSRCFYRVEQTGSNNQLYTLISQWIVEK